MDTPKGITLRTKAELVIHIDKFGDDVYKIYAIDTQSHNHLIECQNLSRVETVASLGKLIENILEKGSQKIFMEIQSYHELE